MPRQLYQPATYKVSAWQAAFLARCNCAEVCITGAVKPGSPGHWLTSCTLLQPLHVCLVWWLFGMAATAIALAAKHAACFAASATHDAQCLAMQTMPCAAGLRPRPTNALHNTACMHCAFYVWGQREGGVYPSLHACIRLYSTDHILNCVAAWHALQQGLRTSKPLPAAYGLILYVTCVACNPIL
jgi:hypothetical protein